MSSTSWKAGTIHTDCTRPSTTSLRQTTRKSASENNRSLWSVHHLSRHESLRLSTLSGEVQLLRRRCFRRGRPFLGTPYRVSVSDADQGLKNHAAAGSLKKGATKHLSEKPPLATWTLPPSPLGSTCPSASARTCRFGGRLAAMAQRQSNSTDPDFTDEEVLTSATASCVFGPVEKRTTISEIHLCVEDHFSEWFPGSARAGELQSPPGPAERRFCSAGPRSPLGSQLPKDLWRDDSRRRLDADLCGKGAAGLTGKRGFGSTRLGRLLLLEVCLLSRRGSSILS
ncbi:hypothetical protein GGP68_002911 [Salinibacter ruber]|uniref:Uncharacterized protein n=1 Tax=Salinibacter ruber TaxID=146919 RepID=A0A9X2TG78_9BACT|nr:hypothetical protein [Salinibacter ruber]MCS3711295.1 hypothetical protein [Salinibacter ruber]